MSSNLISKYVLVLCLVFFLEVKASESPLDSIRKTIVFNAGDDGIDSYRIPTLTTSKKGTLLLFTEARKVSSTDKTPTDIALKRSEDDGKSWSKIQILTNSGENAFMDPVALVDKVTGRIFLFTTLWPSEDHSKLKNTAWVIISDNDGISWSKPREITKEIVAPNHYIGGFGPGAGLQMQGSRFKDRLIVPTRQTDGKISKNRTVYSDDHGETWEIGTSAPDGGEYQISESPYNVLRYNLRAGKGKRTVATSRDGGMTWSNSHIDFRLQSSVDYGGCQGSMLGIDTMLFYVGPAGGLGDANHEDRQNLFIYRSLNGGETWANDYLLHDKSAGYSCITQLSDGRLAIVFEASDSNGFPKMTPGNRPPGWMRLDVIILPKEIVNKDTWFNHL
ncbi:sialidase family protein [Gelidibacter salicanalis]|uniref:exo-alpha-sialidase n=1 Tax=Gelidibacter salicanalis TaxID=291193 RepID=A0A934KTB7_9FLAO|nr:sialidase family protein [Gelidibacter salicanalis]MBJ7879788.1 exo-alpha-sialidase [Gelidibacter salicanalis]